MFYGFYKNYACYAFGDEKSGGYRERDIVNNAKCAVVGKNHRYVKVIRKPNRNGETKTAIFDMKFCSWRG